MQHPIKNLLTIAVLTPLGVAGIMPAGAAPVVKAKTISKAAPVVASAWPLVAPSLAGWDYRFDEDDLEDSWSWTGQIEPHAPGKAWEARVAFHHQNPQNYRLLQLSSDGKTLRASFWRIANGKATLAGEMPVVLPGAGGAGGRLTLQRSAWQVRVLWNGRVLLSSFGVGAASDTDGGKVGAVARNAFVSNDRLQPTEPVEKQDDFMRAQGPTDESVPPDEQGRGVALAAAVKIPTKQNEAPNEWRTIAGTWKTSMMLDTRIRFDSSLNPNPFVYRAEKKNGTALSAIGKWFWSDYSVAVAFRPVSKNNEAPLTAGVSAYLQPNGQAISGEVDFRSGRAVLRQGNQVLARSEVFPCAPNQWHRLFLEPGPGTLRLLVDGVERLRVTPPISTDWQVRPLAQGEAALRADLGGGNFVDFDDMRIAPASTITEEFTQSAAGRWDDFGGTWQTRTLAALNAAPKGHRVKTTAGSAISLTGGDGRDEGRIEAAFTSEKPDAKSNAARANSGVVFGWRDARNYFVARSTAKGFGIYEVSGGKEKLLTSGTSGAARKASLVRDFIVEWRDGNIMAQSAGAVAKASVNEVSAGRIGIWGDGAPGEVAATSFRALSATPGWGEPPLPDRFQKDRLMRFWASNAGAWKSLNYEPELTGRYIDQYVLDAAAPKNTEKTWMHTGDFFDDASVTVPLPDMAPGAQMAIHLRANMDGAKLLAPVLPARQIYRLGGLVRRAAPLQPGVAPGTPNPVLPNPAAPVVAVPATQVAPGNAAKAVDSTKVPDSIEINGAFLRISREGENWNFRLYEGDKLVGTKTVPRVAPEGKTAAYNPAGMLRFVRRPLGDDKVALRVLLDGKTLFSETAPASAAGTKVLVRLLKVEGVSEVQVGTVPASSSFWFEQAEASTAARLDYTFTGAPVDWFAGRGRWEVAERWTCQPQFGFFRGDNAVDPTLWSRFATHGNWTLEAYLATPMDQTRGEKSPQDLNVTVGADGRDLSSGYSFLFAPQSKQQHYIIRGNDLGRKTETVMPNIYGGVHQDWYYIRIERRQTPQGVRFRWIVNDRQIAEYTDPKPLEDMGRIAFWTHNYQLSIARVRLWHDGLEVTPEESMRPVAPTKIKNALDEWSPRRNGSLEPTAQLELVADKGPGTAPATAVKITNPQSGGDWAVFASRQPLDTTKKPILQFGYRVPANVFVNLYLKIDGRWREILFTGNNTRGGLTAAEVTDENEMRLGKIDNVLADNQWHTATFDLRKAFGDSALPSQVEAIAFAAPERGYLSAGIGGNPLGATYWLRDFQALPASASSPKTLAARN